MIQKQTISNGENMPDIPTLTAEVERLTGAVTWWNAAILVMMVVAAIAATGLVATQFLAFKRAEQLADATGKLSTAKEGISNQKIADANHAAGDANEAAGQANERAAKATERAARLELEALSLRKDLLMQGPREALLIGEKRQSLIEELKPFAGQSVEVRYGLSTMGFLQHTPEPAGPDVMGLANSLIKIFQDAEWKSPLAPFVSTLQGPPGLTIEISSKASPTTVTAANLLVSSLKTVLLKVQGPISSELSSIPRVGTVNVFLPKVPGGPAILTPSPETTDETIILVVLAHPQ